jgi:serine/threonine protein kinase
MVGSGRDAKNEHGAGAAAARTLMAEHAGGAPTGESDPFIGTLVSGRYRVLQKIGEGGMGAVYRGMHEALHRPVAIKFLLKQIGASKEMVERFKREAIAAANLQHPNIAAASDLGELSDGTCFLVMELVEGMPLRTLLSRTGRLPLSRAVHILRQLGAALTRAHSMDIVHRDLKPENVIVFDRGVERDIVKVIDFGIARMKSSTFGGGATQLTRIGSVFGTPDYMAPEQVMGLSVDARADQYALGVMAFEMLTGRVPFESEEGSVMYMHVGAPVPRVTDYAHDLPDVLDAVISRMMGKLPDERFASVAEALDAMSEALGDLAQSSLPRPSLPRSSLPQPQSAPSPALPSTLARPIALAPTAVAVPQPGFSSTGAATAGTPAPLLTPQPRRAVPVKLIVAALAALWVVGIAVVSLYFLVIRGGDLSEGMSHWTGKRYGEASVKLRAALAASPDAAENSDLASTLAGSLRDRDAQRELDALMNATALGRSRAMASSLAGVALSGDKDERDASLGLLRSRLDLLGAEPRARVSLRGVDDCDELRDALALIVALGPGPGQDDVRKLSGSDCKELLRRPHLCQQCLKGQGKGKKGKD